MTERSSEKIVCLPTPYARPRRCGRTVYWWDGEYEGECELPAGHVGPHFDGTHWFNDDNEEVDPSPE